MCKCLPWQVCVECQDRPRSAAVRDVQTSQTAQGLLTTLETLTVPELYQDVVGRIEELLARRPQPAVHSADVERAMARLRGKREGL